MAFLKYANVFGSRKCKVCVCLKKVCVVCCHYSSVFTAHYSETHLSNSMLSLQSDGHSAEGSLLQNAHFPLVKPMVSTDYNWR